MTGRRNGPPRARSQYLFPEVQLNSLVRLTLIAMAVSPVQSVRADEITLIAPGGIRDAIQKMIPEFERKTATRLKATFGSGGGPATGDARRTVRCADRAAALAEVLASGHVVAGSETPLANVPVAVAVRKGAAKPDISTPDAVRKMLLAAKAVAYPDGARGAAAGVSFEETLKKLGIAEQMQPRLVRVQGGATRWSCSRKARSTSGSPSRARFTTRRWISSGRCRARFKSDGAGRLRLRACQSAAAAKALLSYLSSPAVAGVYQSLGMSPGR